MSSTAAHRGSAGRVRLPRAPQRGRRRRRRKPRYGRIVATLLVIAAIVAGCVMLTRNCDNVKTQESIDSRVAERAQADALAVINAPDGTMERESRLLSILDFEYQLRSNGYVREADSYKSTVGEILRSQGIVK